MSIVVTDDSILKDKPSFGISDAEGIVVNLFRPSLSDFPAVDESSVGRDIVQFRHLRIQRYQESLQGITTKWSAWTVFRKNESGQWTAKPERFINDTEIEHLNTLEAALSGTLGPIGDGSEESFSPMEKRAKKRSLQTISQVEPNTFFDLVAEVSQHLPSNHANCESLGLIDYTTDDNMMVSFWDNHAETVRSLEVGTLILVKGLHAQLAPDGRIAAALHGLDARRHEYQNKNGANSIKVIFEQSPLAADLIRRRERASEGLVAARQVEDLEPKQIVKQAPPVEPAPTAIHKSPKKKAIKVLASPTDVALKGIPVTSIAEVLAYPERNYKFHINGRVISSSPSNIENFCRAKCIKCGRTWTNNGATECRCGTSWDQNFIWVFYLTVTDGTGRIDVLVAKEDGEKFLNGLKPCDLTRSPRTRQRIEHILETLQASESVGFLIGSYEVGGIRKYSVQSTQLTF